MHTKTKKTTLLIFIVSLSIFAANCSNTNIFPFSNPKWIGVDVDGTLVFDDNTLLPTHIGKPVPLMVQRVKIWLKEGKHVKILTARASLPYPANQLAIHEIHKWLIENIGQDLEVTDVKDYLMIELWDDRAIQIIPNTGERADGKP